MPNTVEDFMSLLYQENVGLVVCLDEEDGKDKVVLKFKELLFAIKDDFLMLIKCHYFTLRLSLLTIFKS
jgi:hypothetical protein